MNRKSPIGRVCGIYGLQCKLTGKWYVGQSVDVRGRLYCAYELMHCKNQPKIYNALKKYGYNGFNAIIIETCAEIDWIMDYREIYWIRRLDSIRNGYNLKEGGSHGKHSDETRKKISTAKKGKKLGPMSDELRRIHSVATKNISSNWGKNISAALVGKKRTPFSDQHKLNLGKSIKAGWARRNASSEKDRINMDVIDRTEPVLIKSPRSVEHCNKISLANKGRVFSLEHRIKLSNARIGKKFSRCNKIKPTETGESSVSATTLYM